MITSIGVRQSLVVPTLTTRTSAVTVACAWATALRLIRGEPVEFLLSDLLIPLCIYLFEFFYQDTKNGFIRRTTLV